MHLVFLNQYYPPDAAPTGVMLEGLVEELVRDGHAVTVLCASGGYAGGEQGAESGERRAESGERGAESGERGAESGERGAGSGERGAESGERRAESRNAEALAPSSMLQAPSSTLHAPCSSPHIIRIRASRFGRGTFIGKLLDYASYYVGVAWKLLTLRPAPDRIVALTTPPLLSVLARLFSKIRGADHAHWVMDLYPDVMAAHGMLGEKSTIYRVLAGLARWGFGGPRCAALLTLGPDMAERVERVRGEKLKTESSGARWTGAIRDVPRRGTAGGRGQKLKTEIREEARRGAKETEVSWVPLWGTGGDEDKMLKTEIGEDSDPSSTSSLRQQRKWGDHELIVMYSGNMGLGHRFGEILEAAGRVNTERQTSDIEHQSEEVADTMDTSLRGMNESRDESRSSGLPQTGFSNHQPSTFNSQLSSSTLNPQPSPIRFVFYGGGKRRAEVEAFAREHPDCAVEVHDYAPAEELGVHLQSADVHLASLDDAWTGTMVPSKLQGIFAAGRPVIFIGRADSSIGRWVDESGGGWVVQAGDAAGLLAALGEARNPEIRLTRGRAARTFAETHFDKRTNVARVAAILAAKS